MRASRERQPVKTDQHSDGYSRDNVITGVLVVLGVGAALALVGLQVLAQFRG